MIAGCRFRCRREENFRQLSGLVETWRQIDTANLAGALVVAPTRADQVAAHNGLDWKRIEPSDNDCPFLKCATQIAIVDQGIKLAICKMARYQVRHHLEPEVGDLSKHLTFERHGIRQDDIVCRYPVRRDDEQMPVVCTVNIANFTAADEGQRCNR